MATAMIDTTGVTYSDELITPQMAEGMLNAAGPNRSLREARVERYAADMVAGNWRYTAEAIKFNRLGEMVDGRHRLTACVRAGVPFRSLVVRGLDRNAMNQMDTGATRSLADVLRLNDERNVNVLGASIVSGWRWSIGMPGHMSLHPTRAEALAWLQENPDIREAIKDTEPLRTYPLHFPAGVAASFGLRITELDKEAAERFLEQLNSGVDLKVGDPRYALRRWATNMAERSQNTGKPPAYMYLAMLIKAWNHWNSGRQVTQLVWKPSTEDFPVLREPV